MEASDASSFSCPGGVVEKNHLGELTGVLKERACEIVSEVLGKKSEEEKERMILEGLERCRESGLCTVATNEINGGVKAYEKIWREGRLKTRVYLTPMQEEIEEANGGLLPRRTSDGMLQMNRVKIFCDGSLGAGTAAISLPGSSPGSPPSLGLLTHTDSALTSKIELAKRKGWRVEIHAIGDRAAEQVLKCAMDAGIGREDRAVITHCQVS